jgi:hypothetical protein
MTARAGQWATREVDAKVHTVASAQLGVAWHTVMDAVAYWRQGLIEDPDRIGVTEAIGVDETKRRQPGGPFYRVLGSLDWLPAGRDAWRR